MTLVLDSKRRPMVTNASPASNELGQVVRPVGTGAVAVTANTPASVTVNAASIEIVAANSSRIGLVIRNVATPRISLAFNGATAVLDAGITLDEGDVYWMNEFEFTRGAVNAIASGAAGKVAIQEWSE